MEDRETPRIHKYGETKNDSNYDGNCTSRGFQFGTENFRPLDFYWTEGTIVWKEINSLLSP